MGVGDGVSGGNARNISIGRSYNWSIDRSVSGICCIDSPLADCPYKGISRQINAQLQDSALPLKKSQMRAKKALNEVFLSVFAGGLMNGCCAFG